MQAGRFIPTHYATCTLIHSNIIHVIVVGHNYVRCWLATKSSEMVYGIRLLGATSKK